MKWWHVALIAFATYVVVKKFGSLLNPILSPLGITL